MSSGGMNPLNFLKNLSIKNRKSDALIALAGNPNVGKSTVFNSLTGLKQHTGNWSGKTVGNAFGKHASGDKVYTIADIPGTYSLLAHSPEEKVAKDFICFGGADAVIVVCDATALAHNMGLVLQTLEITPNVVVCVNLLDEAARKGIKPDIEKLEKNLGVPVVGTAARNGRGLDNLIERTGRLIDTPPQKTYMTKYSAVIENAVTRLENLLSPLLPANLSPRYTALRLLDNKYETFDMLREHAGIDLSTHKSLFDLIESVQKDLLAEGIDEQKAGDIIARCTLLAAEEVLFEVVDICAGCEHKTGYGSKERKIDKLLTGRRTGIPIMLAMLLVILWLTIVGSNYPSAFLSENLLGFEPVLYGFLINLGLPGPLVLVLTEGVYRVTAWVVAVMLPPMAIFFPMFTFLEDVGLLPRIAFNLDNSFEKAKACGKQSLSMCMGFGCNAAGVVGCGIIDSPRERLIAILTNNFVPCNGRFPTLIALISMFFVASAGLWGSLGGAVLLTMTILLGVVLTFIVSRFLSETFLRGSAGEFTLELPPYRKPRVGQILVRSLLDRTIRVLVRALLVAAPAGLIIWFLANTHFAGISMLSHFAGFLDPFARIIGLDGVILGAFILGFPANEIVLPLIVMGYLNLGGLADMSSLEELKQLFLANGWTSLTALCTLLFTLIHWPCSTTCLTIKKETGSLKWTVLAVALPTVVGMIVCFAVASVGRLLGF